MAKNKALLNSTGVILLLNSPEVRADLERRGRAVKAAAGAGAVVTVDETSGAKGGAIRTRVRVSLAGTMSGKHARRHEAKHGTLARALAAGGG